MYIGEGYKRNRNTVSSNSGAMAGRNWRSRYGVLSVCSNDTLFRARPQAWIDRVEMEWLDFGVSGA